MNTGRISEFAANNFRGVLKKQPYSDQMAREFWAAMFLVPSQVRELIKEVQLAKDIGSVIDTFGDGSWRPNPIHVSILQDSMTWFQVPGNPLLLEIDNRLSLDYTFIESKKCYITGSGFGESWMARLEGDIMQLTSHHYSHYIHY